MSKCRKYQHGVGSETCHNHVCYCQNPLVAGYRTPIKTRSPQDSVSGGDQPAHCGFSLSQQ
eukprot:5578569-Amphidinium_carterae.1